MVKSFGRDIPLEHFDIAFDHVSFGYDDRQVLHDVSFTIPEKTSTAIVGPSSSGKTTFSKRLMVQLRVNGLRPIALSTDNYFLGRDQTPLGEDGKPDFTAKKGAKQ